MICFYAVRDGRLARLDDPGGGGLPAGTLWIDLHSPSAEEEARVELALGLGIPTRSEMADIAESSRLYDERDALYMTTIVVAGAGERRPVAASVTFVLTPRVLVTVRYADPLPFRAFEAQCTRHPELGDSAGRLFLALVGSIKDRIAHLLEASETELDRLSQAIFAEDAPSPSSAGERPARGRTDLLAVVKQLGRANALDAKLRDSLLGLGRMLAFYRGSAGERLDEAERAALKALDRDVRSLAEHEAKLAGEVSFLLEATLGLIDIEQNRIIRVFTIAAVIALPPTLIGTIYGMNFEHMPELRWQWGYPLALLVMAASAVLPYLWFQRRGWL